MKLLSIVMPAYNEEKTIIKILQRINRIDFSKIGVDREIIIVNDGSTDKT
ncbi:MAG: glycosyltransferase, partial [Candidatus Woesearchaeota archaeon]